MSTSRQLKLAQRISLQQQAIISELQAFVRDVERCENTVVSLKNEVEMVNTKHANRQGAQEDVAFLEDLLACAKKRVVLEKQIASLDKRSPELMGRVEELVNHPESNPDEQTRTALLQSVQAVREALNRLKQLLK